MLACQVATTLAFNLLNRSLAMPELCDMLDRHSIVTPLNVKSSVRDELVWAVLHELFANFQEGGAWAVCEHLQHRDKPAPQAICFANWLP